MNRYTITYTPADDPTLPTPSALHVKVRNTSATPLRAAYLHGPYTLYTACYPTTFDPNVEYRGDETEDIPQFEPYLKAGGSWDGLITVSQHIRHTQQDTSNDEIQRDNRKSVTWVIEVVSQVIFSSSASVHFEILVGRDEKSVNIFSEIHPPAQLREHWYFRRKGEKVTATKGVFSKSVTLVVDDTSSIWNSPPFPLFEEKEMAQRERRRSPRNSEGSATESRVHPDSTPPKRAARKKKVHFVVLTHGLHSNLGADMLYLKESIDAAAREAKESRARQRRGSDHQARR